MPEISEIEVGLDRDGVLAALRILNRCLSRVEMLLAGMTDESISARVVVGVGVDRPTSLPPILASDCHQPFHVNWQELHASEAFTRIAPYVGGLLAELERRGVLTGPISGPPVS